MARGSGKKLIPLALFKLALHARKFGVVDNVHISIGKGDRPKTMVVQGFCSSDLDAKEAELYAPAYGTHVLGQVCW